LGVLGEELAIETVCEPIEEVEDMTEEELKSSSCLRMANVTLLIFNLFHRLVLLRVHFTYGTVTLLGGCKWCGREVV